MDLTAEIVKKIDENTTVLNDKKNILILPRWYPNKADIQLGTFIQKQAILMKEDFNVFLIYVQADESLQHKTEYIDNSDDGINERIVYFKSSKGPLKKLINARRYKMAQLNAFKELNIQVDLCHVHVPYRSAFLALELNRKGIPFVITEHWSGHLTGEYDKKNTADKTIYKQVLSKAKKLATVSEILQKSFKTNTGFDSEVIPNLIEVDNSEVNPSKTKTASEIIEVLSVSDMIDSIKNITGLITAFKSAHEKNAKLHLTLIGGGPDEKLIAQMIQDFKLKDAIEMKGRLAHHEVLGYYQNCDFYICNSNFETFGMTVAEALIAGKPVISTKCGGPEEYLATENSILLENNKIQTLAKAIVEMAATYSSYNPTEISQSIKNRFGKEVIREKIKSFYNTAIND